MDQKGEEGKKDGIVTVKIALVSFCEIGVEIMTKYLQSSFVDDYNETLGIRFIERQITVKNTPVNLVLWTFGKGKNCMDMLKIICEGAHVVMLAFDLADNVSLKSLRDIYKAAYQLNHDAKYFLVGTKFDLYFELPDNEKKSITEYAKKFAEAIEAEALIYCSEAKSINIKKLFQLMIGSAFGLTPKCDQIDDYNKPILILKSREEKTTS